MEHSELAVPAAKPSSDGCDEVEPERAAEDPGPGPAPATSSAVLLVDTTGDRHTESAAATEESGARRTRRGMVGITMSLSLNCGSGI